MDILLQYLDIKKNVQDHEIMIIEIRIMIDITIRISN